MREPEIENIILLWLEKLKNHTESNAELYRK